MPNRQSSMIESQLFAGNHGTLFQVILFSVGEKSVASRRNVDCRVPYKQKTSYEAFACTRVQIGYADDVVQTLFERVV